MRRLLHRLLGFLRKKGSEQDLDDELAFHLEMETEAQLRQGVSASEARFAALRRFGGVSRTKEEYREQRGLPMIETLLQDLRYAWRMLLKSPGFTAAATLTLALGIGANTYIFSVVDALVLRPVEFPDPSKVVALWERLPGSGINRNELSPANYLDWKAQNHVFDHMAAQAWWDTNLGGVEHPEHLYGFLVTPDFFAALEAQPVLGRTFLPEEGTPGKDRVAMLSDALWRNHFSADPSIVGKSVLLDGVDYRVAGVMGPGFNYPSGAQVWGALSFTPQVAANRGGHYLHGVAHLGPGISREKAQAEMTAIASRLARQYPESDTGRDANVMPLTDSEVGEAKAPLFVLLAAVGVVLLIACANVSNLLLARASTRQREMAIRAALGATRPRMVRQWLVESLLLGTLGGGLGVLLAFLCLKAQIIRIPPEVALMLPGWDKIAINMPVLLFTTVVSVGTGLLFGLLPAWRASRMDVNDMLKEGAHSAGTGRRRGLLRKALIVAEVGLSVALLATAGLMMKSFVRLERVSPGFNPDRVLTMLVTLPDARYPSDQQKASFVEHLMERTGNLPGVRSAASANMLPLGWANETASIRIEGRPEPAPGEDPEANNRIVSDSYFQTMQIPILQGREFTRQDAAGSLVVAVNQAFADRFWPGENPIGKRMRFAGRIEDQPWRVVVAVVGNVKNQLYLPAPAEMYFPIRQRMESTMALVLRTMADPRTLEESVRAQVLALDRDQPVYRVMTMNESVSYSVAPQRIGGTLMGTFAGFALVLAAMGLFGVIAYTVSERTREIGIRMALGAKAGEVCRMVVGQGMTLALIGLLLGLPLAFLIGRAIAGLLYGVAPNDVATFAGVSAILAGVALAACYVPARRAMRVDPAVALRSE